MAFGRSPFETPKEGIQRLGILNGKYTVPHDKRMRNVVFSDNFLYLIETMLNVDYRKRPSMHEVIVKSDILMQKY
jgi:hypothetical protein